MKIADLKVVNVSPGKYVLCRVSNREETKIVLRGSFDARDISTWSHKGLVDSLRIEAQPFEVVCLGGGILEKDIEMRVIRVSHESGCFGREDRSITIELLKSEFPDFSIQQQ